METPEGVAVRTIGRGPWYAAVMHRPSFARALGVADPGDLEILEPSLPGVWLVRRARGVSAPGEFTPLVADTQGVWPERGLALLRRYLDTHPPESLPRPLNTRGVFDLLRATAVPRLFEGTYPDAIEPASPDPGEPRAFRVILLRQHFLPTEPLEVPLVAPPGEPRPPRVPGPPGGGRPGRRAP